MNRIILFFVAISLIVSCSTTKKISSEEPQESVTTSSINDGSSYTNAIVINKKNESAGVDAEYAWLRKNYPGYKFQGQSLDFHKNKPYDIITILTSDGVKKKIYFDISKFYGKF